MTASSPTLNPAVIGKGLRWIILFMVAATIGAQYLPASWLPKIQSIYTTLVTGAEVLAIWWAAVDLTDCVYRMNPRAKF